MEDADIGSRTPEHFNGEKEMLAFIAVADE
jgi:hypothetical protein